ncbi:energy transducer TonB [Sphingomonas sp. CBMAI 2297]|uniref:energy transducer TonB n=1 Tax=Sphingomonas sp. CBMAI 2297 TaxID=2991720 RepID=UPI002455D008|nr:energy transducer TonB [Sphingomonas sp. CBMAI 2297]MDH4746851.1 energy transducer TonB [Sphingomonas sp. CBMAI 2297]
MLLVMLAGLVMQAVPAAPPPEASRKPEPRGRPQSWLTDDDYPAGPFRRGEFGPVKFRADVDAKGKVADCHVIGTSGYSELDEPVCRLLRRRAVFTPGRNAAGTDIPYSYDGTFTWNLPGKPRIPNPISAVTSKPVEVVVELQAVPRSYANPALLRLVFADGKPKACTVELTSGNPKLDAIACEQANVQVPPLKAGKPGWPEPNSRMASVTFERTK